ncbi:MAG: 3',5'-cyclic-nucleotide phosphodiesterase [Halothiobacillaceae bacterium]|nr:3',5'-cyclic-nucleotide phosphodiesterase [Halothiobacillaceae bacterium]
MKLRVLGCHGGIGGHEVHTTAFLLDEDVLIDAGTGVTTLGVEALARIDEVFLTHAHLDHIAALPLLVDTVGDRRTRPLRVHALPATLDALRQHIFNGIIWPNFSRIPTCDSPYLQLVPLPTGAAVDLGEGRSVQPLPACHTVPAVGYLMRSARGSVAFSGDTGACPAFWDALTALDDLHAIIVECALPEQSASLAQAAGHFTPRTLAGAMRAFPRRDIPLYITHMKPGQMTAIVEEIDAMGRAFSPRFLHSGQLIEI